MPTTATRSPGARCSEKSVQHRLGAQVAEGDAIEADLTAHGGERFGARPVGHLRGRVEQLQHPLPAGPGLLGEGEEPGQHPRRSDELDEVAREGQEGAEGDAVVDDQPAAEDEHQHLREGRDGLEHRRVTGLDAHEPGPRAEEPLGAGGQVADHAAFLAEALHHPDPRDRLLHDLGHLTGLLLRVPAGREHAEAQPHHHDQQGGHGHQRDRGEDGREHRHHHDRHDQRDEVAGGDREEGEDALEQSDVGARPRDELAGAHAVVPGEVEPLEALEDRRAQVVLHVERHPAAHVAAHVRPDEGDHRDPHERDEPRGDRPLALVHHVVHHHLRDERGEGAEAHAEDRRAEGQEHVPTAGREEGPQPSDPPARAGRGRLDQAPRPVVDLRAHRREIVPTRPDFGSLEGQPGIGGTTRPGAPPEVTVATVRS